MLNHSTIESKEKIVTSKNMQSQILVVDDEQKLREVVKEHLMSEGFNVMEACNGHEVLDIFSAGKYTVDLILLDWMMPDMNGLDVCKQIRRYSDVPIIFLSAKSDEIDKLVGLEIGADDYITKPFSARELLARIRTVLRRVSRQKQVPINPINIGLNDQLEVDSVIIEHSNLRIDLHRHLAYIGKQELTLTPTEFKLLVTLAQSPGRVYSRLQLLDICLGQEYIGYERSIDTHISNLRKKLDGLNPSSYILTVFGIGYKFAED